MAAATDVVSGKDKAWQVGWIALDLLSAEWPTLKYLDLCCNCLDGSDAAQVATGRWPLLEKLLLHNNHFDVAGISALVKADWLLLKVLDVSCQGVYADVVGILTQSEV